MKYKQCVRHEIINKDGKQYMLCRWCWEVKELTSEYWNKDRHTKTWFIYRCKECMKPINKEANRKRYYANPEKERVRRKLYYSKNKKKIREKRRWNREKENAKRRERMSEISAKIHAHSKEMWYWFIHAKVSRLIKKLWIRPKECPICWYISDKIIAHHPDYNKPYEVVFCCNSCHKLIHLWELELKEEYISTLCESEDWVQLIKCEKCWTKIKKIAWTKFCKECRKLADKESIIRFKEKKFLLHNNILHD